MDKSDLEKLVEIRIKEAKILITAECFEGAYYLLGYAVECALKACIAKKIRANVFPENDFLKQCFSHDFNSLMKAAQIDQLHKQKLINDQNFNANWLVVKDWSVKSRYKSSIDKYTSLDLFNSISDEETGILA